MVIAFDLDEVAIDRTIRNAELRLGTCLVYSAPNLGLRRRKTVE